MKGIIEGLLYVQGDLGLTIEQVSEVLEITEEEAKQLILSLKQDYINEDRGLRINYLGNCFKLIIFLFFIFPPVLSKYDFIIKLFLFQMLFFNRFI